APASVGLIGRMTNANRQAARTRRADRDAHNPGPIRCFPFGVTDRVGPCLPQTRQFCLCSSANSRSIVISMLASGQRHSRPFARSTNLPDPCQDAGRLLAPRPGPVGPGRSSRGSGSMRFLLRRAASVVVDQQVVAGVVLAGHLLALESEGRDDVVAMAHVTVVDTGGIASHRLVDTLA